MNPKSKRIAIVILVALMGTVLAGCKPSRPDRYSHVKILIDYQDKGTTLSTFVRNRDNRGYRDRYWYYDWSTDECSSAPNNPPVPVGAFVSSVSFTSACRRHDFGYRNLKRLQAEYNRENAPNRPHYWSDGHRHQVDNTLLRDMRTSCRGRFGKYSPYRASCYAVSELYYYGVTRFGGW